MARLVAACFLVMALALVPCDVQAGDQCPAVQYNIAQVLVAIGQLQQKVKLQEKEIAAIAAMGKVKAVTALEKTVKAHETKMATQDTKIATQDTKIATLENENQAQETKIATLENENQAQETKIATLENENQAQETKMATQETKIATQETKIAALEKAPEKTNEAVGFTAKMINNVSSSGVMTFSFVHANTDNGYNRTTGVFTCKTPGYYFFFASLLKAHNYGGEAYCNIGRTITSDSYIIKVYTRPGTYNMGNMAAVNGLYVHMYTGDTIMLKRCTKMASWKTGYSSSSFSGVLITPDAA